MDAKQMIKRDRARAETARRDALQQEDARHAKAVADIQRIYIYELRMTERRDAELFAAEERRDAA